MKYELIKTDRIVKDERVLHRLIALQSFGDVSEGTLGGYIEQESNLAQTGDCWVGKNALVYGDAKVFGNAKVGGNAEVSGDARVGGNAEIFDNAQVLGNAEVFGFAEVAGNAIAQGYARISGNGILCHEDRLSGVAFQILDMYEFNIYGSYIDRYIRAGCRSHSFAFWNNYIKTKSNKYLKDCSSKRSHTEIVKQIKLILKLDK